jgi:hypothetical protein
MIQDNPPSSSRAELARDVDAQATRRGMLRLSAAVIGAGALTVLGAASAQAAGTTLNGWPILPTSDDPLLVAITPVPGFSAKVRSGSVAIVLNYVAQQFHARVEPVRTFSGHRTLAENTTSGGHSGSNHMSGTAMDINGRWHPYKAWHDFTPAQVAAIDAICLETSGVVFWGGYFPPSLMDGMHFEIKNRVTETQVAAAVANLGMVPPSPSAPPQATQPNPSLTNKDNQMRYLLQVDPTVDGNWYVLDYAEGTMWRVRQGIQLDLIRRDTTVIQVQGAQPVSAIAGLTLVGA